MTSRLSRRSFIGGALALGSIAPGCMTHPLFGKRWYKGNLHMHTFWSDGRAFPEEAILWYKSHGYDFIGLSDHNVFQDNPERWVRVEDTERKLTGIKKTYADKYLAAFPDAEKRTNANGQLEIRLKTFAELANAYNSAGNFLLLADIEATRSAKYSDGRLLQLHMNYVNLPELLPCLAKKPFVRTLENKPISEFLGEHAKESAELAKKLGRQHLFILNHPIWTWYDVGPEALIDNPSIRFFELCNNGSPFAPGAGLPDDGFDTDRLWDVVNAFRVRRNQPLLYGVGTDDTHHYCGEHGKMLMPGNAWSLVRASALTPDALIDAMMDGDFVTCEMLEPEDVAFDRASGTLSVSAAAKTAVARTIRFIVTKKDFSEVPVKTLTVQAPGTDDPARYTRTINIYDEKIGMVAKTIKGAPGERLEASYTLKDDDLYVRARIEESGQPLCTAHLHPQGKHVAWTQPYRKN